MQVQAKLMCSNPRARRLGSGASVVASTWADDTSELPAQCIALKGPDCGLLNGQCCKFIPMHTPEDMMFSGTAAPLPGVCLGINPCWHQRPPLAGLFCVLTDACGRGGRSTFTSTICTTPHWLSSIWAAQRLLHSMYHCSLSSLLALQRSVLGFLQMADK